MKIEYLDKRYKKTLVYLETGEGSPIYKQRAFPHIRKILGPINKWAYVNPEEFFSEDEYKEAKQAIRIFSFTKSSTFNDVKQRYYTLSKGDRFSKNLGWHPDTGGQANAFAILNHAYNIFKKIHNK